MPSPENKPRRRRLTREELSKKLPNPVQFELPDNALIAPPRPPRPAPAPPPLIIEAERAEPLPAPAPLVIAAPVTVPPPAPRRKGRGRAWLWAVLVLIVLVPLVLTGIGAYTSPPHLRGIPSGQLVYLEADTPSEKTTTLRGLYVTAPGLGTRLLVHETEPQDADVGVREWITQPTLSPDGTQVAFEKQLITLLEEKRSVQNQIWVMPLAEGGAQRAHLVLDLSKQNLKQIVGLAWDSDSSLVFLQDGTSYSIPTGTEDEPLKTPLKLSGLVPATAPDVSATRGPALTEGGDFVYSVQTPAGPQVLIQAGDGVKVGPAADSYALSPDGARIAFVPPDAPQVIRLFDTATGQVGPDLKAKWGWSVFGRRAITSLRWSPDGKQIAYTVSKPPVPDDEIFVLDVASGRVTQLPYRAGRAAWDWGH